MHLKFLMDSKEKCDKRSRGTHRKFLEIQINGSYGNCLVCMFVYISYLIGTIMVYHGRTLNEWRNTFDPYLKIRKTNSYLILLNWMKKLVK